MQKRSHMQRVMNLQAQEDTPIISRASNGLHKDSALLDSISNRYIRYRVICYSIGAAVHLGNILAMALALRGPIMEDPEVKFFSSMEFFYLTIWNLVFQITYAGIGLACDLPVVLGLRSCSFLDWLRRYRKTFYSGILWPCGMSIGLIFWPVYSYDRDLIFPSYIDKALSQASNYVMHMFIVLPILSDLLLLPNQKPASQKYTLSHSVALLVIYYIAILIQFAWRGIWPYPLLTMLYGTIYFPFLFVATTLILLSIYYLQWPIMACIWTKRCTKGL